MTPASVLARIVDNPKLPNPPALTLRILDRANRPNCSIADLGKMIALDAALCGKMLKLVNSSLFGLQKPVTSIERALNLLGLNHVRSLVLSLSLPSLRFAHSNNEQMKTYWKSSVTVAIVCREIALRQKWADPDSEMVTGLLCDLGSLLLQETFPEQAALVAAAPPEQLVNHQCELERQHFGVDHAEAGAYFLETWKLGADLIEPIRVHHRPQEAAPMHADRANLLYFATRVAHLHQTVDRTVDLGEIVSLAKSRYGMDDNGLLSFLETLNTKIGEFAALIEVDLGAHESFTDLFSRATENLTKLAVEASLDSFRAQEEKSKVERSLSEAKEALQMTEERLRQAQKMEAIGRLAGGIAHDFNNLLTVISGNCEILLCNRALDAESRGLVETILNAGERASDLTRQLLAFSRKQRLVSEVVYLNHVIANMSKILCRLLGDDVQFLTRLSDDLELVKCDPSQIAQVILNLAVNARDAMPQGGALTIETFNLQLEEDLAVQDPELRPGRYAVVTVRDTGCGMDDATLRQIFEPFFTTKGQGKGTGLGLATVHGIIRQSGGYITVASVVGQGTVFHIYLPTVQSPLAAQAPLPTAPVSHAGAETILLVEDEEGVREFARRTLATFGFKVLVARNGVEALEVEREYAGVIHLLFSDKMMPWMNGPQLVQKIKERRPDLRVLYMSGYSDETIDRQLGLDVGTPFLQKPFTTRKLIESIREVLGTTGAV